ncbi:MAG: nitroreductase/quinone reductase family protein [Chloroflexota bacterium]
MTKFYNKPSGFTKKMNSFLGWLGGRGMGPKKMVQLTIKGRKSGQPRTVAVNIVEYDGKRYLVAPRGNTEWSRNAIASGGEAVIKRGKPEDVRLVDIPVADRVPIIQKYVEETAIVRAEFGVEPDSSDEEYQKIAEKHPTFRIDPR